MKLLTTKNFLFSALLMAISINTWASYGSGDDGPKTVNSTEYTDDVRSKVTFYYNSSTGSNPYVNTISITCATDISASLLPTDLIIIVDMEATGRNYDVAEVVGTSGTGTTSTITATCWRTNQPLPNVDIGDKSTGYVQVFRVPQWESVTLNPGGVLTCHQWDPISGTGGILAFLCENTLTFNGGIISTVGKGQAGYLGQAGGLGALAIDPLLAGAAHSLYKDGGSATGGTAWPSFNHQGGFAPGLSAIGNVTCNLKTGYNGGCGGNSLDGEEVTPHDHVFSQASFNTLTMNFGRGGAEGASGQGPGAGGHGGGGGGDGVSQMGTNGLTGDAPAPGSHGGAGGNGGIGGGMVYIKACTVDASTQTGPLINTSGMAGTSGFDAVGDGGNGGAGGEGANGICSGGDFISPAGGGGHGTPGNGGDGGDGGNGGDGGSVWMLFDNASNFTSSNILATGGNGGSGVSLGSKHGLWEHDYGNQWIYEWTLTEMTPPLSNGIPEDGCQPNMIPCPCKNAGEVIYGERVDRHDNTCYVPTCSRCNDAMWLLSTMTKVEALPGNIYKYTNPAGLIPGISSSSYCLKTPQGLYAWYIDLGASGTCAAPGVGTFRAPTHFCEFTNSDLDPDWALIASNGLPAGTRVANSHIEWNINGYIIHFDLTTKTFTGGTGYVEAACGSSGTGTYVIEERPRDGYNGQPGQPGVTGEVQLSPPVPSGGNRWKKEITGMDEITSTPFTLQLMPNPAQDFVQFETEGTDGRILDVKIYDLKGRVLKEGTYRGTDAEKTFSIDVSELSAGTYIFSINDGASAQEEVLVIQR